VAEEAEQAVEESQDPSRRLSSIRGTPDGGVVLI
jgi:hypothetical protein